MVKLYIVEQGRLQIGPAVESGLLQELADAAVESFDHAIRLGMPGWYQAVFDTHGGADCVEGVLATGLPVLCGEVVGEWRAVVGQQLNDPDRRCRLEPAQEVDAAFVCHVTVDMQEHPTRGAVDGHEQIAARGFVWHLRQVFDVDVNKAGFVVLEGLLGRDRFSFGLGNDVFRAGHALAFEQTGNARARDVGVNVLPGNVRQVVERQIGGLAQ